MKRRFFRSIGAVMRIAVLAAAICLSTVGISMAADAQASMKKPTNIPAQPLGLALKELAKERGLQVVFRSEVVGGLRTHGVSGELTANEALTKLLEGTNLVYSYLDEKTVTVLTRADLQSGAAPDRENGSPQSGSAPDESSKEVRKSDSFRVAQVDQGTAGAKVATNESSEKKKKEEPLEEIVVTGTHIHGVAPVGAQIRTIDRTEIEESGYTTTEQLIQSIPQNFRGGAAGASADTTFSAGPNASFNTAYGSGINLRGLGNGATLVLVNGHRVASSGSGYFTDISTIPVSAIDHIEILTDGASAVYGSEAIAGVVNIVLRKDSEGVDVGGRYGKANGFSSDGGNVQLGHQWASGGATLGTDFSHQGVLDDSERAFTSSVPSPTSIFPSYNQTAVTAAAHQDIGDRFEVHGDAQYSHKKITDFTAGGGGQSNNIGLDRWSGAAGLTYKISDSWTFRYEASGGREETNLTNDSLPAGAQPASFLSSVRTALWFSDHDVGLTGDLFALPAGYTKLAVGAAYRTEKYTQDTNSIFLTSALRFQASRNVTAGYGELRIPIFSELNAQPGLQKLTLSAAGRIDRYSDFGHTINPKYGISWFPTKELELRGAYSTSFRAPAVGYELYAGQAGTSFVLVESSLAPDGATQIPLVQFSGGKPGLQAETARNVTFGVDWEPTIMPGLGFTLNYYDISYTNQVATPPFSANPLTVPGLAPAITKFPDSAPLQSLVNAALANGATYFDITGGAFGPDPLASAVYLYDARIQNLSTTRTSGLDFAARYRFEVGEDHVDTRIDVTRINKFVTELTSASPQISEVNTVGFPARLRVRGLASWAHGPLSASIAANFVSSYPDTSSTMARDVAAYTTVDLGARYNFPYGVIATIEGVNIFNRLPPFVTDGTLGLFPGSHYDPANASPLGRLVTLTLAKHW